MSPETLEFPVPIKDILSPLDGHCLRPSGSPGDGAKFGESVRACQGRDAMCGGVGRAVSSADRDVNIIVLLRVILSSCRYDIFGDIRYIYMYVICMYVCGSSGIFHILLNEKKNHADMATVENTVMTGHRSSDQLMLGKHPGE